MVPEDYIRKQTLVNNERYITPELKEMENLVLNAETKINQMEYELFTDLRLKIQDYIAEIQETSSAIARLDVLCSYAAVSTRLGYVKPVIDESLELEIEKGRHPVIEQMTGEGMLDAVSDGTGLTKHEYSYWEKTKKRDKAILILFLTYGLRLSELQQLNLSSFNFSRGEFKIYRKRGKESIMNCCQSENTLDVH